MNEMTTDEIREQNIRRAWVISEYRIALDTALHLVTAGRPEDAVRNTRDYLVRVLNSYPVSSQQSISEVKTSGPNPGRDQIIDELDIASKQFDELPLECQTDRHLSTWIRRWVQSGQASPSFWPSVLNGWPRKSTGETERQKAWVLHTHVSLRWRCSWQRSQSGSTNLPGQLPARGCQCGRPGAAPM